MKYGTWSVAGFDPSVASHLQTYAFSPLTAAILASRGYTDGDKALNFLNPPDHLSDPFQLTDMDKAVTRLKQAISQGEHIVVYGDYDVDGITATCLLTEFLRSQGANCQLYIPHRMEDGYGLSCNAIDNLHKDGTQLIVTVDCGITAEKEAKHCQSLGIDLIITDHHTCKDTLPQAVAVVDPHRYDDSYPHKDLAGVGVAFQLAAAMSGDSLALLHQYSDLVCMGTVADVMPLTGENRLFVRRGLEMLEHRPRMGLRALMEQCGCDNQTPTASTIGYTLAPRINAAGRMGNVYLATSLFMTQDKAEADRLALALCNLNRDRQGVEAEIYRQAVAMLRGEPKPSAIVLGSESWHQGVVGIVASRLSEEYGCPTFLICLDGENGKASSRSYGGFNLFGALSALSHLLENYGGHELAAGFTIRKDQIDTFRIAVSAMAATYQASDTYDPALELDCVVTGELLTTANVESLDQLEPCGSGCAKATVHMIHAQVEQLSEVGGGKHLRLKLRQGSHQFSGIFFSTTIRQTGLSQGDWVDVAFTPQINEFRGHRTVQLNLVDIRPMAASQSDLYNRHCCGHHLSIQEAGHLLPSRADFVAVWKYLTSHSLEAPMVLQELCHKISTFSGSTLAYLRLKVCLDVFQEQGLLAVDTVGETCIISLTNNGKKVDLDKSAILNDLKQRKAGA